MMMYFNSFKNEQINFFRIFGKTYKSKTTIITERGDTMAGGGELLNKTFFEILDTQQFAFYKYYDVLFNIGLKPNEVHTLSIILSFNKAGKDYLGSYGFICKKLNITPKTALNALNSLIEKNFIIKKASKGGKVSLYKINELHLKHIFLNNISGENPQIQCKISTVKQCQNRTVNSNEMLQPNNQNYEKISQIQCKNPTVNSGEIPHINNQNSGEIPQIQCKNSTVNSGEIPHNKNIYNNNNNIYAHSKNEHDKTKTKIKSKRSKEELEKKFIEFWDKYPKKVSKKNAKKAFIKLNPSDEKLEKIYKALAEQTKKWKDKQFIPYPATWINGERWEDETDTTAKQNNTSGIYEDKKIEYVPVHENLME